MISNLHRWFRCSRELSLEEVSMLNLTRIHTSREVNSSSCIAPLSSPVLLRLFWGLNATRQTTATTESLSVLLRRYKVCEPVSAQHLNNFLKKNRVKPNARAVAGTSSLTARSTFRNQQYTQGENISGQHRKSRANVFFTLMT